MLDDRIVPTVTHFSFDGGSGFFDYDDAEADAADNSQLVAMTHAMFTYNTVTYDWSSIALGATVDLKYGRPDGFSFEVIDAPYIALDVTWYDGTYTVLTIDPHGTPTTTYPTTTIFGHGPPVLDTSGETTRANFGFTLADGSVVGGTFAFDTDDLVSTGSVNLTELNLRVDNIVFVLSDFAGTPTADFSNGVFLGLTFSLTSVPSGTPFDELAATGDGNVTATVDEVEQVKPICFDTDEQVRFVLSDGKMGRMSFVIPWEYIDPEESTQSLPLTEFVLVLTGESLTEENSDFTTSPTAEFEYGKLVGITFGIDTSELSGYTYSEISSAGLIVSAVNATTSMEVVGVAAVKRPAIIVDFASYTYTGSGGAAHSIRVRWTLSDGDVDAVDIDIPANATPSQIRDLVYSVLDDNLDVTTSGDTRIIVKGPKPKEIVKLHFILFTPNGSTWDFNPSTMTVIEAPPIKPQLVITK